MEKKKEQQIAEQTKGAEREPRHKTLLDEWERLDVDESIVDHLEYVDTYHELTEDQLGRALALFQAAAADGRWEKLGEYAPEPGYRVSLSDMLSHLPVEQAIAFLERSDTFDIEQRQTVIQWVLVDRETPFYTLDELATTTDRAVRYHERNRAYLLEYGYALSEFERCRFLWRLLCRLYYIRMPHFGCKIRAHGLDYERLAEMFPADNLPEPYDFIHFVEEAGEPIISAYDEWDDIRDVQLQDAARIEGMRAKLFHLKLEVLKELAGSARSHDADGLWDRVLALIRETLTAEEAELCLRIDRIYEGYDIQTGEMISDQAGLIAGGLTSLLEVVGHYEKEIRVGTLHRCKAVLEAAGLAGVDDLGRGELRTSDGKPTRSYFAYVDDPQRDTLDQMLEDFRALSADEVRYWSEYRTRVNQALENELYAEITVRRKIKRSLAHKFEPHVSLLVDWAKSSLELTGELPAEIEECRPNNGAEPHTIIPSWECDPAERMLRDDELVLVRRTEDLVQCVSDADLPGVLSIVAEDLAYWGGSLRRLTQAQASRDHELSNTVFVKRWLARTIVGAQQAYEMLEFTKGSECAASFKQRFDSLDEERRTFIDELLSRAAQNHLDGDGFGESSWEGLYHMCDELARYVGSLSSQVQKRSEVEILKTLEDGPYPPNLFQWKGKAYELPPTPWRLLAYMWDKTGAQEDDIVEHVWGVNANIASATVRATVSRVNKLLLVNKLTDVGTLSVKNGYVIRVC